LPDNRYKSYAKVLDREPRGQKKTRNPYGLRVRCFSAAQQSLPD